MIGGLIAFLAPLIAICLFLGIAVARRRPASRRAFAMLVLIIFAVTYIWSALFEIWINNASLFRAGSLLHAFGPNEMPSHFLGAALFWFVPALILAAGAYLTTRRRSKEAQT